MPKPMKDAYDPTDTQQTHDILTSIVNKEQSRIRQANTPAEPSEPVANISGNTAIQQHDNTAAQQHSSTEVFPETPLPDDVTGEQRTEGRAAKTALKPKITGHTQANVPSVRRTQGLSPDSRKTEHNISGNTAIQQYDNTAAQQYGSIAIGSDIKIEELLACVRQQRATEVITLRIPSEMDEWLEDYVHAHRKEGCKKQEVIAWAVMLLRQELERSNR